MVWKDGLIIKLQKIGISGNILDYIKNFLTNRTFQVKIANSLSDVHHLQNGTPQGSIISPLLFLVMINDFPNNPATNLSLFADDSAIYKASTNLKFLEKSLQKHLSEIENWCNRWGFKISTSKTTVVLFTKQKALQKIDLSIHGQKMKLSSSVKFLGIIFDKNLTWKEHFQYISKRTSKRLNLLKCLSSTKWGSDKITLITLYKSLIRPILGYGSIVFQNASNTQQKVLSTIQNKALKIICASFKTTPISHLEVECGILPLHLQRLESQIRYALRIKAYEHKGLIELLQDHWANYEQYNKNKFIPIAASTKDFFSTDLPPIQNPRQYAIPPWHYKELNVDTFLSKLFTKENTDPQVIKQTTLSYLENFSNRLSIFTDGSKDTDRNTGFAFTIPQLNINRQEKLPSYTSVFTSELLAIKSALKLIKLKELRKNNLPPVIILSDSKSALEAIQQSYKKSQNN
jgi:hypothetical protein